MDDLMRYFESAVITAEGDDLYVSFKFEKPAHLSHGNFKVLAEEFVADLLTAADLDFERYHAGVDNGTQS